MNLEPLIAVIGSLLVLIGTILAFFLRTLNGTITAVEKSLIKLDTEHLTTIRDLSSTKGKVDMIVKEVDKARFEIHSLKGGQSQLLKMLEDMEAK